MNHRPVEVLLVEDSFADACLVRDAMMAGKVSKKITVVSDGALALDLVHRRGQFRNAARPDLILLDLNLPKRDGLEVLRDLKSDPELRNITVIVLTTSGSPRDVNTAYELAANCYIVKPGDLDELYRVMRGIEEFWMTLASLPTLGAAPAAGSDDAGASQPNGDSAMNIRRTHQHPPPARPRSGHLTGVTRPRRRADRRTID